MNYNTRNFIAGTTTNIKIYSYGSIYKIPLAVYNNALKYSIKNTTKFNHNIMIKIDNHVILNEYVIFTRGVPYRDVEELTGTPLVIYFMHCIALETEYNMPPQEYILLDNFDVVKRIVDRLAVISWCDDMIKECGSFINYKKSTCDSIKNMVRIVRALFVVDSALVGGYRERLRILRNHHKNIQVPDYIMNNTWMMLPSPKTTSDTIDRLTKYKNEKLYTSNRSIQSRSIHIYEISNDYDMRINDIILMQDKLLNDIITRELKIICNDNPEYLKISKFGSECSECIYKLLPLDELLIYHENKPKMTICDVFRYGLAAAINADYE